MRDVGERRGGLRGGAVDGKRRDVGLANGERGNGKEGRRRGGAGGGGAAGGYISAMIAAPSGTYSYAIGAGGTAGAAGTNGFAGAGGASGFILVEEYYV